MAKNKTGVKRPSAKKAKELDYSYGVSNDAFTTENKLDEELGDDKEDEEESLIVGSRKATLARKQKVKDRIAKARKKEDERMKKNKYFGYTEFAKSDTSENTVKSWNLFIGYVLIRIISPVILIVHCLLLAFILWKVYGFDFTGELSKHGLMPLLLSCIAVHSALVHVLNKWLFSSNYYKRRHMMS